MERRRKSLYMNTSGTALTTPVGTDLGPVPPADTLIGAPGAAMHVTDKR
ncbi:hypothetical protein GCM10023155_14670 [Bremerella cremea]